MRKNDHGIFALIAVLLIVVLTVALIIIITKADSIDDKNRENKQLYGKFCRKVCESKNYEIEEDYCICSNGKEYKIEK